MLLIHMFFLVTTLNLLLLTITQFLRKIAEIKRTYPGMSYKTVSWFDTLLEPQLLKGRFRQVA